MQKKSLFIVLSLLMLTFALLGCAATSKEASVGMEEQYIMSDTANETYAEEAPRDEAISSSEGFESEAAGSGERVVLKDASLAIKVDDPTTAVNAIALMAERMGGFVVNSNMYQNYYYNLEKELPQGFITVRVPAESLNAALAEIKGLTEDPAYDVTSESVSGQDVTSQYTDLQSRLRNLEDAQEQMRIFMDEAKTTKDVLTVYAELKSISEEIEILKGQLKYYDEASSLSSISVDVQPKYEVPTIDIGGWQPEGVAKKAIQSLVNAFQFIVEALIWIVLFILPVLLMIAAPIVVLVLILRALIRRSKKKSAAKKVDAAITPSTHDQE